MMDGPFVVAGLCGLMKFAGEKNWEVNERRKKLGLSICSDCMYFICKQHCLI